MAMETPPSAARMRCAQHPSNRDSFFEKYGRAGDIDELLQHYDERKNREARILEASQTPPLSGREE